MTIHLTTDQEQMIRSLMQVGGYASENDAINDALRLLEERHDENRLAELRREIAIGVEQADNGELGPFDPHATLARVRARHSACSENP